MTSGMYYVSNDNGYYKKFRLVGVGVPSEQTVEVINVMTGSDALLLPKSVSFNSFVLVLILKYTSDYHL